MDIIFEWLVNAAGSKQKMRQLMKKGKNLTGIRFTVIYVDERKSIIIKAES